MISRPGYSGSFPSSENGTRTVMSLTSTSSSSHEPGVLKVLGDGTQKKSYLYIQDCIDAIFLATEKAKERVNLFNLGTDEYIEVKDSIRFITEAMGVKPSLQFGGGSRGWIGDNPFIFLDCSKIRRLGWKPKLTIRQGIERTLQFLRDE